MVAAGRIGLARFALLQHCVAGTDVQRWNIALSVRFTAASRCRGMRRWSRMGSIQGDRPFQAGGAVTNSEGGPLLLRVGGRDAAVSRH